MVAEQQFLYTLWDRKTHYHCVWSSAENKNVPTAVMMLRTDDGHYVTNDFTKCIWNLSVTAGV